MRSGWRVASKADSREGVVLMASYAGSANEEDHIQWDDGSTSWEMAEDLRHLPNKQGDAFRSMRNGFGVRDSETFPKNPLVRDNASTDAQLFLRVRFGLMKAPRHPAQVDRDRQLTLDIRERTRMGTPTRGSTQRPDKRKLALAAAVAAGQAQLVRRGRLTSSARVMSLKEFARVLSRYAARDEAIHQQRRRLSLNQKRKLKASKNRRKKS